MRVFLSGPMGVGKSTTGALLARRLDAAFLDLDERLAAAHGAAAGELLQRLGERRFRELEERAVAELLRTAPGRLVVALGGGTVTTASLRRRLLRSGRLLTLHAPLPQLLQRLGPAERARRPLLRGEEPAERLRELWDERIDAYAECHEWVDASPPPERVAEAAERAVSRHAVLVPLGRRSYRARFVPDGHRRLAEAAPLDGPLLEGWKGRAALVVCEEGTASIARHVLRGLEADGVAVRGVTLPGGRQTKTLASVQRIWRAGIGAGLDRRAVVVAVGGGAVGDVAGFAAGTLLRGVGLLHVPTTLLAMADSSVGGKAAVDLPEGKNLVGLFHQPLEVLLDVALLDSLPERELRSGLAEVVKAAWLLGEEAVAELEGLAEALLGRQPEALQRAVEMALRCKAELVAEDERDTGRRHLLNLGHTLGHAVEADGGYERWRHGEAVALGLVAAMRVARALGAADARQARRLLELLRRLGLPTDLGSAWRPSAAAFLARDKKRRGSAIRFVVPGPPGHATLKELAPDELLDLAGLPGS